MIEVQYKRWGILPSKIVFFGKDLPSTEGYHFVLCENCFTKLPYHPLFNLKEKSATIIDLTKENDAIINRMSRMRRKVIRVGLRMGYQITHQKATMDMLKDFKALYNKFIPAKGATPIVSLNYFKALMPYMTIFKGKYEGRTLETMLLIHDEQTVKGFYKARDESIKGSKILNYIGSVIQWEILTHFKHLGYRTFDFGSLDVGPGIQDYKLSFGGDVIPTYFYEAAVTPAARVLLKASKVIERGIRKLRRTGRENITHSCLVI